MRPLLCLLVFASSLQASSVWEDRLPAGFYQQQRVIVSGDTAYVAGWVAGGTDKRISLRAYQLESGRVLWNTEESISVVRILMAKAADQIVLAMTRYDAFGSDIVLVGYNATDGKKLWTRVFNKGTNDELYGFAANNQQVVAVGVGGYERFGTKALIVSCDLQGNLLWENFGEDTFTNGVAMDQEQAYVMGPGFIRGYRLNDGGLDWQWREKGDIPASISLDGSHLYILFGNQIDGLDVSNGDLWINTQTGAPLTVKGRDGFAMVLTDSSGSSITLYESDGRLRYSQPLKTARPRAVLDGGWVVVADQGNIIMFDPDGRRYTMEDELKGVNVDQLEIWEGKIVVVGSSGNDWIVRLIE